MNNSIYVTIASVGNSDEAIALQVQTGKPTHNANATKRKSPYNASKGHTWICRHYGQTNHTVDTCFIKHSYPPGFKTKGKSTPFSTSPPAIASVNNNTETTPPILPLIKTNIIAYWSFFNIPSSIQRPTQCQHHPLP